MISAKYVNKKILINEIKFMLLAAEGLLLEMLQLGALKELQRLHDQLVESVDTCRLDRYNTSDKSSRWFFSSFESFILCWD